MKFLTDLFTEDDGVSWCIARISFGASMFIYLLFSAYLMAHYGKDFSLIEFAGGLCSIMLSGGSAIALKAKTQILNEGEKRQ